ncbi:hypothetical protein [Cupriavidus sp. H18C1]|uniref:hypothetical protein n=1 Tax=Cupriavidus sp. H18C1 TaxID=3241601 RepID=UPI003BB86366
MSLEIGVVLICIVSMFVTWFAFGRELMDKKSARFLYWLKSSLFMGACISAWIFYKEPGISFVHAIVIAMALAGFVNLIRSQWIFLLP